MFPDFRFVWGTRTWLGELQPTQLSPAYSVRIRYRDTRSPVVHVLRPSVSGAPHRYPDGSLCLFFPGDGDWISTSLIAQSIVPWAAEWLYFYECWRDTGTWFGDEAPHSGPKTRT